VRQSARNSHHLRLPVVVLREYQREKEAMKEMAASRSLFSVSVGLGLALLLDGVCVNAVDSTRQLRHTSRNTPAHPAVILHFVAYRETCIRV
jgi:hypothetical protein